MKQPPSYSHCLHSFDSYLERWGCFCDCGTNNSSPLAPHLCMGTWINTVQRRGLGCNQVTQRLRSGHTDSIDRHMIIWSVCR